MTRNFLNMTHNTRKVQLISEDIYIGCPQASQNYSHSLILQSQVDGDENLKGIKLNHYWSTIVYKRPNY